MDPSDILPSIFLLVMSGLLCFLLFWFWKRRGDADRTVLWDITFAVAAGHVVFFMVLPALFRFWMDWRSDTEVFVKPTEVVLVYAIELVSFSIWAIVLTGTGSFRPHATTDRDALAGRTERFFVVLVMAVGTVMAIDCLVNRTAIDSNRYGDPTAHSITERYLWPLTPLCIPAGSVIGGYVLARGRKAFGDVAYFSAAAGVVTYLAVYGLMGVRGALIWPVVWVMLVDRIYHPQAWLRRAVPLAAAVLAVAMLQGAFVTLRKVSTGASITDKVEQLRQASDERSELLESAEFRLGAASRYSVGFVRMWDAGREAGWNPIVNSFYAPIPRLFMPNKPVPTSRDGDRFSTGMYLIVAEIEHRQTFSMSEFLTGSHAYWEFGWIGVVALSVVAAVYGRFAMWFSGKFGQAGPAILFFFFKPWGYNNPKLWVSDAILEVVQLVPPIILFWLLARVVAGTQRALSNAVDGLPSPGASRQS